MREIFDYYNIGDSLSALQFNFACLDIKLSNLQSFIYKNLSNVTLNDYLNEAFEETLALSANWETAKEQVHNASAYWDSGVSTIIYNLPFPQGTSNEGTIRTWLMTNFPASSYPNGFRMNVVYFEWYKNPALHNPPSKSQKRFGLLTQGNNVHINKINNIIYVKRNNTWNLETDNIIHTDKPCLYQYGCSVCWGRAYYPSNEKCIPSPTYYQLSCMDMEEEVELDPCTLLDTVTATWEFPILEDFLEDSPLYQQTSATDFSPYIIGFENSYNPDLEFIDTNVYRKYVNNSSIPLISNSHVVERLSAFNTKHVYSYNSSGNTYTNVSTYSSLDFDFSGEDSIDFPIDFKQSEMTQYMYAQDLGRVINQASSACSFELSITTTWYRWVTNNLSVSATPYWHIGIEPGNSLGFAHDPESGVPDSSVNWALAYSALSGGLSAYFGVFDDMMGYVQGVEID